MVKAFANGRPGPERAPHRVLPVEREQVLALARREEYEDVKYLSLPPAGEHLLGETLAGKKHGGQVDVEGLPPLLNRDVHHEICGPYPRVVDEDVDRPEELFRTVDKLNALLGLGEVRSHGIGLHPDGAALSAAFSALSMVMSEMTTFTPSPERQRAIDLPRNEEI